MSWGDVDNPDKITTQAFAFIKVIQGLLRWGWAFRGYCYGVRHWGQAFRGYCFGVRHAGVTALRSGIQVTQSENQSYIKVSPALTRSPPRRLRRSRSALLFRGYCSGIQGNQSENQSSKAMRTTLTRSPPRRLRSSRSVFFFLLYYTQALS